MASIMYRTLLEIVYLNFFLVFPHWQRSHFHFPLSESMRSSPVQSNLVSRCGVSSDQSEDVQKDGRSLSEGIGLRPLLPDLGASLAVRSPDREATRLVREKN